MSRLLACLATFLFGPGHDSTYLDLLSAIAAF
jgi:hypothetical protein